MLVVSHQNICASQLLLSTFRPFSQISFIAIQFLKWLQISYLWYVTPIPPEMNVSHRRLWSVHCAIFPTLPFVVWWKSTGAGGFRFINHSVIVRALTTSVKWQQNVIKLIKLPTRCLIETTDQIRTFLSFNVDNSSMFYIMEGYDVRLYLYVHRK